MGFFFPFLMSLVSLFMILLVLVQRGRGGGLAGALGGAGGSSAFGAKAGDMFTRITFVTATIWIVLCAGSLAYFTHKSGMIDVGTSTLVVPGENVIAPSAEEGPTNGADTPSGESDF